MTKSPHNDCMAHSGLNVKVNILLTLSTVAVGLLVTLFPVAVSIQSGVAVNTQAILSLSQELIELKDEVEKKDIKKQGQIERIQARLRALEK